MLLTRFEGTRCPSMFQKVCPAPTSMWPSFWNMMSGIEYMLCAEPVLACLKSNDWLLRLRMFGRYGRNSPPGMLLGADHSSNTKKNTGVVGAAAVFGRGAAPFRAGSPQVFKLRVWKNRIGTSGDRIRQRVLVRSTRRDPWAPNE